MTDDEVKLRRTAYAEFYKKTPLNAHLSCRDKFINWLSSWSEYWIYRKNK